MFFSGRQPCQPVNCAWVDRYFGARASGLCREWSGTSGRENRLIARESASPSKKFLYLRCEGVDRRLATQHMKAVLALGSAARRSGRRSESRHGGDKTVIVADDKGITACRNGVQSGRSRDARRTAGLVSRIVASRQDVATMRTEGQNCEEHVELTVPRIVSGIARTLFARRTGFVGSTAGYHAVALHPPCAALGCYRLI